MVKTKPRKIEGYCDRLAELSAAARRMGSRSKADCLLSLAWTAYEANEQVARVTARNRVVRSQRV